MKKLLIVFLIFISLLNSPAQQTWRSSLYPQTWTPGYKDNEGRYLHDFSYAGYKMGMDTISYITTNIVDVTKTPYFVDNTGQTDVTTEIQKALDAVGRAGGGVVY